MSPKMPFWYTPLTNRCLHSGFGRCLGGAFAVNVSFLSCCHQVSVPFSPLVSVSKISEVVEDMHLDFRAHPWRGAWKWTCQWPASLLSTCQLLKATRGEEETEKRDLTITYCQQMESWLALSCSTFLINIPEQIVHFGKQNLPLCSYLSLGLGNPNQ